MMHIKTEKDGTTTICHDNLQRELSISCGSAGVTLTMRDDIGLDEVEMVLTEEEIRTLHSRLGQWLWDNREQK